MKYFDFVFAAVLCVGQSGLAGTGETVNGSYEFRAVVLCVFLLAAVAGGVAVTIGDSPNHGQSTFFVFAEVSHT